MTSAKKAEKHSLHHSTNIHPTLSIFIHSIANMKMVVNKTLKNSVSHGAYISVGDMNNNQNNKNKLVKYVE